MQVLYSCHGKKLDEATVRQFQHLQMNNLLEEVMTFSLDMEKVLIIIEENCAAIETVLGEYEKYTLNNTKLYLLPSISNICQWHL